MKSSAVYAITLLIRRRIAHKACKNLVTKSLGGKTLTQQKATEAFMQLIELEQAGIVMVSLTWQPRCRGLRRILYSSCSLAACT